MWISGLKGLIQAPTETKQVEKNTENHYKCGRNIVS